MSGSLSTGLGLLSALRTAQGVTLGGVTLTGMATPERMPFGGSQQLVVHKLPGGGRVIDAMGPDERDIEWSGLLQAFDGTNAVAVARQIDAMRRAGAAVTLAWGDFSKQVVIRSFEPDYTRGGAMIPYRIACVVASTASQSGKPTLLGSLASDLSASLGLGDLAAGAKSAISVAQKALPVVAVLTRGGGAYTALAGALGVAGAAASAASGLASGQLDAIVGSPLADRCGAAVGAAAAAAKSALAGAENAAAFVGRAAKNLANAI